MSAVLQAQEPSARYLAAEQPTLVRQFELLATAPGGVGRLRELVVLLALQGKLVAQDPRDGSALEWLADVRRELQVFVARGQAKAPKNLPPVDQAECWFDLPTDWQWARLNELVMASEAGWSPSCPETPRQGGRWGVLKVSAVSWGKFDPAANKELPHELEPRPEYEVRAGDFLVSRANTAELVARSVVVDEAPPRLMLSDKIIRLTFPKTVDRAFLNLCNNSAAARSYYAANASGTSSSMKNVSRDVVLGLPIPIPPPGEQARIVARVDELMRLCDALEAQGRLEAEQHARLLGTLLGTLTDSSTSEELAANWQRVADHFDLLLDRPEAVDALEQTILQLAVRGLLVPQDPKELPAHVLLNEVVDTRVGHFGDGNDGRDGEEAEARSAARAFDIPRGWVWATLGQFTQIRGGKRLPVGQSFAVGRTPYGYIQITNMKMGTVLLDHLKYLEPETFAAIKKYTIDQDDLYITIAGTIGQVGEVPPECHGMNLTENAAKIVFRSVDKKWLRLVLSSPFCQSQFIEKTVQQAQPKLALHRIASAKVPLPPLAEQQRIVARVTELRRLCADLRQRLAASQTTQSHLAEALVDMAVA